MIFRKTRQDLKIWTKGKGRRVEVGLEGRVYIHNIELVNDVER
jgi:hypothetical protein